MAVQRLGKPRKVPPWLSLGQFAQKRYGLFSGDDGSLDQAGPLPALGEYFEAIQHRVVLSGTWTRLFAQQNTPGGLAGSRVHLAVLQAQQRESTQGRRGVQEVPLPRQAFLSACANSCS